MSVCLPDWVSTFFSQAYAASDLPWPLLQQNETADGLKKLLNLDAGDTVLDQCAGTGGLSQGLARLGLTVYAVEQSQAYVDQGQARCQEQGLPVHWACADAGVWQPPVRVDAGINWHSSLGYGGPEGAHQMLDCLRRSVRSGGRWLVEINHRPYLDAHFIPDWTTDRADSPWGPVQVRRQGRWENDVLVQDWTVLKEGRPVWSAHGTRCWHPKLETLRGWVDAWGDKEVGLYDGAQGGGLSLASPRCVLVVEKASLTRR